jgi:hypothetical protein
MQDLSVADINITINHEPRIADVRLGESLGFGEPRAIRRLIDRHREPLERFGSIPRARLAPLTGHSDPLSAPENDDEDALTGHGDPLSETEKGRQRAVQAYWLNRRQALYLCTKSETERATEVTIAMVEVFDQYLRGTLAPKPIAVEDLSAQQRAAIRRRAQELLKPLLRELESAMERALLKHIAELLASGQLPDIPRLYAELPEYTALPPPSRPTAPQEEITFAEFRALLHGARLAGRAGMGAVFIDDDLIMFETIEASVDDPVIDLKAKMYGRARKPTTPTTPMISN